MSFGSCRNEAVPKLISCPRDWLLEETGNQAGMENTGCKPWLELKHGPKAQNDGPESTDVFFESVTSWRFFPHQLPGHTLMGQTLNIPLHTAMAAGRDRGPEHPWLCPHHLPLHPTAQEGTHTAHRSLLLRHQWGWGWECTQKPQRARKSQGLVEMSLARTGLMGRQISALCCSPNPFLTHPRHSRENKAKRGIQNPGRSIKQQKPNIISCHGSGTLLTAIHICHCQETLGTQPRDGDRGGRLRHQH